MREGGTLGGNTGVSVRIFSSPFVGKTPNTHTPKKERVRKKRVISQANGNHVSVAKFFKTFEICFPGRKL